MLNFNSNEIDVEITQLGIADYPYTASSGVDEGTSFAAKITLGVDNTTAKYIPAQTTIYWTLSGNTGVTADDFDMQGSFPFTGEVVFADLNSGEDPTDDSYYIKTLVWTTNLDAVTGESGEVATVSFYRDSARTDLITSLDYNLNENTLIGSYLNYYDGSLYYDGSPTALLEGKTYTFNVNGTSGTLNNRTLYWKIHHNTTSDSDFDSVEGSFTCDSTGSGSYSFTTQADLTSNEGIEQFYVEVYSNASRTIPVQGLRIPSTGNVFLYDNSQSSSSPSGQALFSTTGSHTWTAPSNVTSVSVVCIGGGGCGGQEETGSGDDGPGGGGGGLAYATYISVVPGTTYNLYVGAGGTFSSANESLDGEDSWFISSSTLNGGGGKGISPTDAGSTNGLYPTGYIGGGAGGTSTGSARSGGGSGGNGGRSNDQYHPGGGGGAGGYSGSGGRGANSRSPSTDEIYGLDASSGSGGGGGGGTANANAGGGGGVGINGKGSDGQGGGIIAGSTIDMEGGTGGSSGIDGGNGNDNSFSGYGGQYGGGGGGGEYLVPPGNGGNGGVRIIWGPNRYYPDTNTADV